MRVSSCRCCVLVSRVLPVQILKAVFWIVCSLLMSVLDAIGDQMGEAYSIMERVIHLYVLSSVSLCWPQFVPESALVMLRDLLALLCVWVTCALNVSFGSRTSPSILGLRSVRISELLMVMLRILLGLA